jgi:hypothetical protein
MDTSSIASDVAAPHLHSDLSNGKSGRDPQPARIPLDIIAALGACCLYFAIQFAFVRLPLINPWALYGITLVSLVVTITYTVALVRSLNSASAQLLLLVVTAAVLLPFMLLPFVPLHTAAQLATAKKIYLVYIVVFRAVPGLRGLLLITFAVAFGSLVARLIREIKLLLPVAVVLAIVDLYVVFGGGLVAQANSGKAPAAQVAMQSLTVGLTPRPAANVNAPAPLAVGFADYLFVALFFACFARFGMPARRTFVVLCSILCLYMVAVIVLRLDLPALIPIAAVVVGCNLSAFRYKRDEAFAMLYAGIIVCCILGALVFMARR